MIRWPLALQQNPKNAIPDILAECAVSVGPLALQQNPKNAIPDILPASALCVDRQVAPSAASKH